MNIAIFTDNFFPQVNGVVSATVAMANELVKRGHKVLFFAPNPGKLHKYFDPNHMFEVILLPSFPALIYPEFRHVWPKSKKVLNIIKEREIDIIHFPTPLTVASLGIWCAKKLNIPLVGHFHTFFATTHYIKIVNLHWIPFVKKIVSTYSNIFYNYCNLIISPAEFTAEFLKNTKIKPPIKVIPNGIEIPELTKHKNNILDDKLTLISPNTIIFIGRLSVEKSVDILISAINEVKKTIPDIQLLLVGSGPNEKQLHNLAIKLHLEKECIFTGVIPHNELLTSKVFKKCKIFVTASKSENQPMTIIESMLNGLPIIGVNSRGIPEMIKGNGLIVEKDNPNALADAIIKLLQNENYRNQLSKKSKELSKKYLIQNTTNQIEHEFISLINKQPSKG